jgi:hypothetical protein
MPQPDTAAMEQAIRNYIQTCNDGDAVAISACFRPDAAHYFTSSPKWLGASAIGRNFAAVIAERGITWTVDQVLTDAARRVAAFEWTQFEATPRRILRGVDWIVFDEDTTLFREIRSFLTTKRDPNAAREEFRDFDYAGRGYPIDFPSGNN